MEFIIKNGVLKKYIGQGGDVVIPDGVTSIGNSAFDGCKSLKSVEIPNSVTNIGHRAFYGCSKLTNIIIPSSVMTLGKGAFHKCTKLVYNIKDGLKYLGDDSNPYLCLEGVVDKSLITATIDNNCRFIDYSAFSNCHMEKVSLPSCAIEYIPKDNLKEVVITSGEVIGEHAFLGARSLDSVEIPNSLTSIGDSAFSSCVSLKYNIKDGLKYLGNNKNPYLYLASKQDTSITTAIIDNNCRFIAWKAFANCSSLTSIEIPDSVTSIGGSAFSGCSSLTNIEIPDSVTSIGSWAFAGCGLLKSVELSNNIMSIGEGVFALCWSCDYNIKDGLRYLGNSKNPYLYLVGVTDESLTTAVIDDNCRFIGASAFDAHYRGRPLSSVVIPNGVIDIGEEAFGSCGKLTSIIIPDSVTRIGKSAFANCWSLSNVSIGNGVTTIGSSAFEGCESLVKVTLGKCVKNIDFRAFQDCRSLESIELPDSVTGTGYIFSGCKKLEKITMSEKQLDKVMLTAFSFNGKTICVNLRRNGECFEAVCSIRRENLSQSFKYEKEYLLPLDEKSAFHYDKLLVAGEYSGFKMTDNWRVRAIILRLRQEDLPIKDEKKEILVEFLRDNIDILIKLAKKLNNVTYLQTAIKAGLITEQNKTDVLTKIKKTKLEGIEDIITNFS